VANLPWSLPAPELEELFAQCGTVKDVEVRARPPDSTKRNAACTGEPLRRAFEFFFVSIAIQLLRTALVVAW